MEQNREIIWELRGRRGALGDGDARRPKSHIPPSRSQDQIHKDESASTPCLRESLVEERAYALRSLEEKIEDVRKEMASMREALKARPQPPSTSSSRGWITLSLQRWWPDPSPTSSSHRRWRCLMEARTPWITWRHIRHTWAFRRHLMRCCAGSSWRWSRD